MLWLAAGEYAITPVDHVTYPNRILREAGLLTVRETDDGEQLDLENSKAFAIVDHQFSHVYVADSDERIAGRWPICSAVSRASTKCWSARSVAATHLEHARSGEVILISSPNSWQAYYYWLSDDRAPRFARTVDIHRKPGYDPVELFFDPATKSIPLDATLVERLARRPGRRSLAANRPAGLGPNAVPRRHGPRHRRLHHRPKPLRPASVVAQP